MKRITSLLGYHQIAGYGAILGCLAVVAVPAPGQQPHVTAPVTAAASFVGADLRSASTDPLFQQPYIDVDEWRSAPFPHRYIHGGFRHTETRFSFYFPKAETYRGRFFQHIAPVPDSENTAYKYTTPEENHAGFAFSSGGYYVETNGGGASNLNLEKGTVTAYRANAASAELSRALALRILGGHRPYGYAYGGSGGGYRTVGSIENTTTWDGVVPYVLGSTMALPNVFTVRMQALRILQSKLPGIVDAMDAGGSGDPYAGLNQEESAALREVTRMGFPLRSWTGWRTMGPHGLAAIYPIMRSMDGAYFTDFWTKPGYQGANPPPSLLAARIQHATTIKAPATAKDARDAGVVLVTADGSVDRAFLTPDDRTEHTTIGFHLADPAVARNFLGGDLVIRTGAAKGQYLQIIKVAGDMVILGANDPTLVAKVKPGDQVVLDTSDFLAVQTYHRHQVPKSGFPVFDQFRASDGTPRYPQRPLILGPLVAGNTAGGQMTGRIKGKVILLESAWDREAYPWQADWYAKRVREQMGSRYEDMFRVYITDRALHNDATAQEQPTQTVSYMGMLHQALRDLSRWVENGTPPPASTHYHVEDGQVVLAAGATERHGQQPVVTLKANGTTRVDVAVGTTVRFTADAVVPAGGGRIIETRFDMADKGNFPISGRLMRYGRGARSAVTHRFASPGTYFVSVRSVAQRDGDKRTPYARLANIDRVRVVVR